MHFTYLQVSHKLIMRQKSLQNLLKQRREPTNNRKVFEAIDYLDSVLGPRQNRSSSINKFDSSSLQRKFTSRTSRPDYLELKMVPRQIAERRNNDLKYRTTVGKQFWPGKKNYQRQARQRYPQFLSLIQTKHKFDFSKQQAPTRWFLTRQTKNLMYDFDERLVSCPSCHNKFSFMAKAQHHAKNDDRHDRLFSFKHSREQQPYQYKYKHIFDQIEYLIESNEQSSKAASTKHQGRDSDIFVKYDIGNAERLKAKYSVAQDAFLQRPRTRQSVRSKESLNDRPKSKQSQGQLARKCKNKSGILKRQYQDLVSVKQVDLQQPQQRVRKRQLIQSHKQDSKTSRVGAASNGVRNKKILDDINDIERLFEESKKIKSVADDDTPNAPLTELSHILQGLDSAPRNQFDISPLLYASKNIHSAQADSFMPVEDVQDELKRIQDFVSKNKINDQDINQIVVARKYNNRTNLQQQSKHTFVPGVALEQSITISQKSKQFPQKRKQSANNQQDKGILLPKTTEPKVKDQSQAMLGAKKVHVKNSSMSSQSKQLDHSEVIDDQEYRLLANKVHAQNILIKEQLKERKDFSKSKQRQTKIKNSDRLSLDRSNKIIASQQISIQTKKKNDDRQRNQDLKRKISIQAQAVQESDSLIAQRKQSMVKKVKINLGDQQKHSNQRRQRRQRRYSIKSRESSTSSVQKIQDISKIIKKITNQQIFIQNNKESQDMQKIQEQQTKDTKSKQEQLFINKQQSQKEKHQFTGTKTIVQKSIGILNKPLKQQEPKKVVEKQSYQKNISILNKPLKQQEPKKVVEKQSYLGQTIKTQRESRLAKIKKQRLDSLILQEKQLHDTSLVLNQEDNKKTELTKIQQNNIIQKQKVNPDTESIDQSQRSKNSRPQIKDRLKRMQFLRQKGQSRKTDSVATSKREMNDIIESPITPISKSRNSPLSESLSISQDYSSIHNMSDQNSNQAQAMLQYVNEKLSSLDLTLGRTVGRLALHLNSSGQINRKDLDLLSCSILSQDPFVTDKRLNLFRSQASSGSIQPGQLSSFNLILSELQSQGLSDWRMQFIRCWYSGALTSDTEMRDWLFKIISRIISDSALKYGLDSEFQELMLSHLTALRRNSRAFERKTPKRVTRRASAIVKARKWQPILKLHRQPNWQNYDINLKANQSYSTYLQQILQTVQYVDTVFPPNDKSLGALKGEWRRLSCFYQDYELIQIATEQQVKMALNNYPQGSPMCSFFSWLNSRTDLLKIMFQTCAQFKEGLIIINFLGIQLELDDFVPAKGIPVAPLYSRAISVGRKQVVWPILVEKAMAKMLGSYSILSEFQNLQTLTQALIGIMKPYGDDSVLKIVELGAAQAGLQSEFNLVAGNQIFSVVKNAVKGSYSLSGNIKALNKEDQLKLQKDGSSGKYNVTWAYLQQISRKGFMVERQISRRSIMQLSGSQCIQFKLAKSCRQCVQLEVDGPTNGVISLMLFSCPQFEPRLMLSIGSGRSRAGRSVLLEAGAYIASVTHLAVGQRVRLCFQMLQQSKQTIPNFSTQSLYSALLNKYNPKISKISPRLMSRRVISPELGLFIQEIQNTHSQAMELGQIFISLLDDKSQLLWPTKEALSQKTMSSGRMLVAVGGDPQTLASLLRKLDSMRKLAAKIDKSQYVPIPVVVIDCK